MTLCQQDIHRGDRNADYFSKSICHTTNQISLDMEALWQKSVEKKEKTTKIIKIVLRKKVLNKRISAFIERVTGANPIISTDYLLNSVEAMISIEKVKKGELLLSQLADILTSWNVDNVATVIGELTKGLLLSL